MAVTTGKRLFKLLGALLIPSCVLAQARQTPRIVSDSGFVGIDGGRLYYQVAGMGPVVVFINGANLDAHMWDAQFAALARDHRVIRYDERGFGRSSPANVAYSADHDLWELCQALRVTHASFVGLSLGGRIAIDFALAHPGAVDRLVLASPGISGWNFARGDTSWVPVARAAAAQKDSIGVARAWLESDWMKPAMEQARLRPILRQLITASAGYWMGLHRHGDTERPAQPPALGRTRNIGAPTLVIVGSRDVPDIQHIADTLVATMPHVRRVVFAGAGHVVNLEQSARFTNLVAKFLRPTPN